MKAIHFLHISDTHLNARPDKGFIKSDVAAKLRQVFDQAAAGSIRFDFCLITGDLAHEGDDEDYAFIAQLFAEAEAQLGCPLLVCLGNHDNRDAFYRSYLKQMPQARYNDVRTVEGLRLIILDTKVGAHAVVGRIGDDQLAWLSATLKEPSDRGSLILLHHPPISPVVPDMSSHCLEDGAALAQALVGTDVLGLFSGHTHATAYAPFLPGIMNCTAGSTAFNLRMSQDAVQMLDTLSWNVCKIDATGRLVITSVTQSQDRVAAEMPLAALSPTAEYDPATHPVVDRA